MSATIKDVAKLAGVSASTVSLVLNNKPRVSEKTKKKVLRAAEMLNYYPNLMARSLVKKRTNTLGLIIPHTANYVFSFPYFVEIIRGISNTVRSFGYRLMVSTTYAENQKQSSYLQIAREHLIDGFILLDIKLRDERIIELKREQFPFVLVGKDPWAKGISYVDPDDVGGALRAMRHLINLGHERIAFLNGPLDYMVSFDRMKGYRIALAEARLNYDPQLVRHGDFVQESGYQKMREILNSSVDFTAVFAASDLMAMGAMKAIKEKGLRIPEDIAVVGFDDIPGAAFTDPPLTTVRQPIYDIGALAAKILIEILEKKRFKEEHIIIPTELIIRRSCGFKRD